AAVFAQATATPQMAPSELASSVQAAVNAAQAAEMTSREKTLLVALLFSAVVMITALVALLQSRRRYRREIERHRTELRKAFADAYIGMKDGALDIRRVRDAERALERIITDLEHYLD